MKNINKLNEQYGVLLILIFTFVNYLKISAMKKRSSSHK